MKFCDLKIGKKVLLMSIFAFMIALIFSFIWIKQKVSTVKGETIDKEASNLKLSLKQELKAKKDVWFMNALQIASNPAIANCIENKQRDNLFKILKNYGKIFKENTNFKNIKVHLIDAELKSFVKSWDFSKFGENLNYSPAYRKVKATGKPLTAMDISSKGLRLKGLFPIKKNSEIIGIVNFEGGLNSFKKNLAPLKIKFLYLMNKKYLDKAPACKDNNGVENYIFDGTSKKNNDKDFYQYISTNKQLDKAIASYSFDNRYLTVVQKVKDLDGNEIGIYILGMNTPDVLALVNKNTKIVWELSTIIFSIFLFLIIVGLYLLDTKIIKPITQVTEKTSSVVFDGKLDIEVDENILKRKDEIGKLGNICKSLIEFEKGKERILLALANNNWDVEYSIRSDQDTLGIAINKLIKNINSFFTHVNSISDEVNNNAQQVNESSQSLSQGATTSAASLEEITSTMTEIGSQSKTNSDTANTANKIVVTAKDVASKGSNHMNEMTSAMEDINSSSQEISKIIKVIDDIAFQTNLLALNAAVEAARAGRHGKGFAVVAEEVRNLASRSAKAARETSELIDSSQGKVDRGTSIANETAESLNEIVTEITKAADLIGEISAASNEQAIGVAQVSQGLQQIDEVTQQNTASSEEIASSANYLANQSAKLKELLSRFKLKNNNNNQTQQKTITVNNQKPLLLENTPSPFKIDGWGE